MLAVKHCQFFQTAALEIFDRFQIFFQFIGNGGLGRTLAVLFVGFPNIPDNEVEVIQHHVAEIFIIADMGGLQHFQMGVIFAGAIPFNDFMPDGIDKGVEVLNLHGGNPIHINLNIRKKLDKVLMGGSPFTLLGFTPDGEWALISYEISAQASRIGYISGELLDGLSQRSTLSLASLPVSVTQDTCLTDDPDVSQAARMQLKAGDSATLLALHGPWYAYVETMLEGQAVRGFVPRACLRCPALTEEAPEAAARLVGEWEFIGGGEMLGDYVNFQSDGRAAANWVPPAEMEKLSDAEREEYGEPGWATYQVYQCTERETANYWSGCEYILVIRNDAGYIVGLYGLIFNTAEAGHESFGLYFGEGGGNYARYDGGTSQ